MDIIEVNPLQQQQQQQQLQMSQRAPRQTEAYIPQIFSHGQQLRSEERQQPRLERSPIFDYVDFGAQTGNNGAYSWFADYPAHN